MAYVERHIPESPRLLTHPDITNRFGSPSSGGDWTDIVRDPNWLPHSYDPQRKALNFAYLDRRARAEATFLDARHIPNPTWSGFAPVERLPEDAVNAARGPLHFIFHTSFCCSTLLARAFDQPGASMGLKEPAVLGQFARDLSTGRSAPGAIRALETTLHLLSRPLQPNETQIVKPSNVFNALIPQMMHLRPDAKAILLYSPLESFLRTVARRGIYGRLFARQLFQAFSVAMPLDVRYPTEELMQQTDMQIAVQAWLMQIACFRALEINYPHRTRTLNSDTLLADPAVAFAKACEFFDVDLDEAAQAATVNGPVFRQHAKQPNVAFDGAAYKRQQKEADPSAAEVAVALDWGSKLAQQSETPIHLGDTLLTLGRA